MMLIAGILVGLAGYWLAALLRSSRAVNVAAVVAFAVSSLGAFFWEMPPYRYLFEMLRHTYVVLMFGMFFLSTGILVRGIVAHALKAVRTASQ
jgi:di/tricarboxylate transporter